MNPAVSIIVPVYNAAPFLAQCLDSVLAQSWHNWELIAVNDGSTDDSGRILGEYACAYPGKIIGLDIPHGGVVRARQLALEQARGTYLFFLDGDDYLPSNAVEKLMTAMQMKSADLVIGSYTLEWPKESGRRLEIRRPKNFSNGREALLYCLRHGECFLPIKLYRTELFRECVCIPENLRYQEDLVGLVQYCRRAQLCVPVEDCVYYYVRHGNNVTATNHLQLSESLLLVNHYLNTCEETARDKTLAQAFRAVQISNLLAFHACGASKEDFNELYPSAAEREALLRFPLPVGSSAKARMLKLYINHPSAARVLDNSIRSIRRWLSIAKIILCRIGETSS